MPITNDSLKKRAFLDPMYQDGYFPKVCVDRVRQVLVTLCEQIEQQRPADLAALYRLTHAATESINDLEDFFEEHDSEIETGARGAIGEEFAVIAEAYGFDADIEELIATRDW